MNLTLKPSKMAKLLHPLLVLLALSIVLTCSATMYIVGDNSGWEISSDLDTWAKDKRFSTGDILVFQYPSGESVSEVTKENYDKCNTTNVIKTYSNGNTSVPLTKPGDEYFISGNRLYCLGGMKLHVTVEGSEASAPAEAPGSSHRTASSKTTNPAAIIPTSDGRKHGAGGHALVLALLGFSATVLCMGYA